ncbi:cytochrome P450 [Massilia scottii]|uniref:cytochrome P450 n=1 Tax=Massilia scottii TaxID=3057166 RepID=UPI002796B465|nr:cytochrome P450 [Massilia sp. CCM 9029]MDQ1829199.1 cytochrome P450 [Massilia sp. CCM 9029]
MRDIDADGALQFPLPRACPHHPPPEYRQLRLEQPVARVRTPRGDLAWLITRHQDIRAVLTDKRFSSDPLAPGYPSYLSGDVAPPPGFFMQMDAPVHSRLRSLVIDEFKGGYVETLRPKMQAIVDSMIDAMLKLPPPVDFVAVMALPTASLIICELLGVPYEDSPFIQSRTDTVLDRSSTAEQSQGAAIELMMYFDRIVTEKEQNPGDDLLGRLVANPANRERASHQEMVGIAALLLLGGYDTMAQVMGLGTLTLMTHPDQLADLQREPALLDTLVDELVRYWSVNHAGLPRAALEDVEVGGQLIKAGEGVLVMLNSGNRDDSVYPDADQFDIRRQCPNHVGFGHGLHKCIGAAFARLELKIVFGTLFERIPGLQLAGDADALAFRHEMVLYGLKAMPVTWPQAAGERA